MVDLMTDDSTKSSGDNEFLGPYKIGEIYFVRTVTTSMASLGRLKSVYEHELVFTDASWIADTGRFSSFLKGEYSGDLEVESFENDLIVGRRAIADATIKADLLR